tara:strand:- start:198 stop:506 length:309 start_codon:yes stop_codon:yes gene_type:complete
MKKFIIIFFTIFLILFTALIKNSTKRIDDEIFIVKENNRVLKNDFEMMKLEYNYLSSADQLIKFQDLYFSDKLIKKDLQNIKIIYETNDGFKIEMLNFVNEQ